MSKKTIILVGVVFVLGMLAGVVATHLSQKKEAPTTIQSSMESDTTSDVTIPSTTSEEEQPSIPKHTSSQLEMDSLSDVSTQFVQAYFSTVEETKEERLKTLNQLLSDSGKEVLLKEYSYQEGTDMAQNEPIQTKNYVNFDAITGKAQVMSFMVLKTKYEDNAPVNAQTIVQIKLSKNEKDQWKVDYAEMRLLNQSVPGSFYT